MNDKIMRGDSFEYAEKVLQKHGMAVPTGWETAMYILLMRNAFLEVIGYGDNAEIVMHRSPVAV